MIQIKNLTYNLDGAPVLRDITLTIDDGEIVGIIGKSGSGKTALMRILSGRVSDYEGEVLVQNRPVRTFTGRQVRQSISAHLASSIPDRDETLFEYLMLSRMPFKKFLNPFSESDHQMVLESMSAFEISGYRDRPVRTLSGDVIGRVLCAFSFIRGSKILLMDNPTSHMDIYSISLLQKAVFRYSIGGGNIAIVASHDINFITQTVDRVLVLNEGRIEAEGDPQIVDTDLIKKFFNLDVFVSKNIYNGKPNIHFFPHN
jgi:ABC-type cobalamin/Fe3+-siderophores transport system ATPase subunit